MNKIILILFALCVMGCPSTPSVVKPPVPVKKQENPAPFPKPLLLEIDWQDSVELRRQLAEKEVEIDALKAEIAKLKGIVVSPAEKNSPKPFPKPE